MNPTTLIQGTVMLAVVLSSAKASAQDSITNVPVPSGSEPLTKISPQDVKMADSDIPPVPGEGSPLVLGIVPGDVPDVVKAHLKLDGFAGVIVEELYPGSPADQAGLKKMDIILKVGEKPIGQRDDLRIALMNAKDKDVIPVEIVRDGQRQTVEVTMDAKYTCSGKLQSADSVMPRRPTRQDIENAVGAGRLPLPPSAQGDVASALQNLQALMDQRDANGTDIERAMAQQMEMMYQMAQQMRDQAAAAQPRVGQGMTTGHFSKSFSMSDAEGIIEVTSDSDKGTTLIVRDKMGKILYNGPYNTPEDKAKLPADVSRRVSRLNIQF